MESPQETSGVSTDSVPRVTLCWYQPEEICDLGLAGFSAFLMLSQVPCDWNGTEVLFHSQVVLSSHEESSQDLEGVCGLHAQGDTVLGPTGKDLSKIYKF